MVPYVTLKEVFWKGIAASLMIALGVAVLLKQPIIGAFLFALGLLVICEREFFLFTGKCGYVPWAPTYTCHRIFEILIINVWAGMLIGFFIGATNPEFMTLAADKIANWETHNSIAFIQACFCGAIMFIAVDMYDKKEEKLGILFGVPIFIFCGFQHCIANSILLGMAQTFNPMIFIHILGNWVGAICTALIFRKSSGY